LIFAKEILHQEAERSPCLVIDFIYIEFSGLHCCWVLEQIDVIADFSRVEMSSLIDLIVHFLTLEFRIAFILHLSIVFFGGAEVVVAFRVSVKLQFLLFAHLHIHD